MKYKTLILLAVSLTGSPLMADETDRILFSFESSDSGSKWRSVNDGVMGGRSDGRFSVNAGKHMEFYSTLSLSLLFTSCGLHSRN